MQLVFTPDTLTLVPVVEAGSLGYMCSYAALTNPELIADSGELGHPHSEPCCASRFFAQTKMRDEYGFEGYVQSDCGAVNNEDSGEQWATSAEDAAAKVGKQVQYMRRRQSYVSNCKCSV